MRVRFLPVQDNRFLVSAEQVACVGRYSDAVPKRRLGACSAGEQTSRDHVVARGIVSHAFNRPSVRAQVALHEWRQRRSKGICRDHGLAGQRASCKDCKVENARLKELLAAAKSQAQRCTDIVP